MAFRANDAHAQERHDACDRPARSTKAGKTLPWKTARDVINAAIQARFVELEAGLPAWPCDFPSAQFVKLKVAATGGMSGAGETADGPAATPKMLVAVADLEPSQVQELGDVTPKLLELKVKSNTPIRFQVRIEIGDGVTMPSAEVARKAKAILRGVKDDLEIDQR